MLFRNRQYTGDWSSTNLIGWPARVIGTGGVPRMTPLIPSKLFPESSKWIHGEGTQLLQTHEPQRTHLYAMTRSLSPAMGKRHRVHIGTNAFKWFIGDSDEGDRGSGLKVISFPGSL